jgi:predicted nucleic acid-binding protein
MALEIISQHARLRTGAVSIQVLSEYFSTVTRKLMLDASLARAQVEFYSLFQVVEPRVADVLASIDLHRLRGFSFWDALILHCAKLAGCRELLTEDMQDGQVIDGVRIVNPFL